MPCDIIYALSNTHIYTNSTYSFDDPDISEGVQLVYETPVAILYADKLLHIFEA